MGGNEMGNETGNEMHRATKPDKTSRCVRGAGTETADRDSECCRLGRAGGGRDIYCHGRGRLCAASVGTVFLPSLPSGRRQGSGNGGRGQQIIRAKFPGCDWWSAAPVRAILSQSLTLARLALALGSLALSCKTGH
jgi:hypothetical protein